MEENHYRTLGVSRTASKADIEAAYRKFIQTVDPKYVAVIRVWTYAYCVLKDDERRIKHDSELDKYETSNKSAAPNVSTTIVDVNNSEIEVDDTTNKSNNEKTKKKKLAVAIAAPVLSTFPPPSNVLIEEDIQRLERKVCRNFFLISMAIIPLILIIIGWFDAKVYSFDETSTYPIKRSTSTGSANLIGNCNSNIHYPFS
jgi:hypothetical protein